MSMTPTEFEAIRLALGVSVLSYAKILGVTPMTIHNLKSGRVPIRPSVARGVRWLHELYKIDPKNPEIPGMLRKK